MDANKTHWEKARREQHRNATSYLEQILVAAPQEITAVRPLNSNLKNHQSKMNKTWEALTEKQRRT